jgi:hypothetical protein
LQLETIQANRGLADAASLEASKPLVEVRLPLCQPWLGWGWLTRCLLLCLPCGPRVCLICQTITTPHAP